jgi:hypothetical protein
MGDNSSINGEVWVMGVITIILVILKVLEKIDWSWWWVFSPLLVPFAFFILVIVVWGSFCLLFKEMGRLVNR